MQYTELKKILVREGYRQVWKTRMQDGILYEYFNEYAAPDAARNIEFFVKIVDGHTQEDVAYLWPANCVDPVDPEDILLYAKENPNAGPKTKKVADLRIDSAHVTVIWHRNDHTFPYHVYGHGYESRTDPDGVKRYHNTKRLLNKFDTLGRAMEYVAAIAWEIEKRVTK